MFNANIDEVVLSSLQNKKADLKEFREQVHLLSWNTDQDGEGWYSSPM